MLLSNLSDVYGLHQLINILTRVTCASSTLIDVAFTKCLDRVVCSVVSHVSLSDHSLVYVFCKVSIDPTSLELIGNLKILIPLGLVSIFPSKTGTV